jgi:hypothetical protein
VSEPRFTDLVGDDLPQEEAARLRRVHRMLVEAGPPPELPPSLADGPAERGSWNIAFLPRRRAAAALLIAAAIALLAFGGGYLAGNRHAGFKAEHVIPMHGTTGIRANAVLEVADRDASGNWPMRMVVRGLPDLGRKGYYELLLTRGSQQVASCGTFVVAGQETTVRLNAPYLLPAGSHAGWVVISHIRGRPESHRILMTT